MKAAAFFECGSADKIQIIEVPNPVISNEEVLVKVEACALNHLDLWVLAGPADDSYRFPFWGGADIAGVIIEAGQGVKRFKPGERVLVNPSLFCGVCSACISGEESLCPEYGIIGRRIPGGLAEYIAVRETSLMALPDDLSFEEAAAVPLVYQTAWRAIVTQAGVRPGEDVLILGASGGVSTAAIQIAKLAGARVIAVTSSTEKMEKTRRLGADFVLDRTKQDIWSEITSLTGGRGVDAVIESVGAETWDQCLQCLVKGGRMVSYGRTSGNVAETNISLVYWNQLRIIGSTMSSLKEFADVMRLIFQFKLHPVIDRVYPFEQTRQAYERLQRGDQFGKVVIQIPG